MNEQIKKVIQRLCDHKDCQWYVVHRIPPAVYYSMGTGADELYSTNADYKFICTDCRAVLKILRRANDGHLEQVHEEK